VGTEEPGSPSSKPPRNRPGEAARQLSAIIELPILLVACVAIGGGAGYLLDNRIHTSPVFTLIFGLLGFAGGMIQLVRRLSKDA